MADLTINWLGLTLKSPLILAASPLSRDPAAVAEAVAAGAGAVIMHSLFEEQVVAEQMAAHRFLDMRLDADAEARTVLPDVQMFGMDGDSYLQELANLLPLGVPVIASLNGNSPGGWVSYARKLEDAGAAALELNLYDIVTSPDEDSSAVEDRQLRLVASVVAAVSIPVSVKLGPFYTALPAFIRRLEAAGVRGVTLFNRLYQPGIDIDNLDVSRELVLSTSSELPLRLQALALLSPRTELDLACSGGVHSGRDAAKAIASGAHVVQLASALLEHGPGRLGHILSGLLGWLDTMGYTSCSEARGVLNLSGVADPQQWTRLNYIELLDGWRSCR